jgi:hypothetical protein
VIILAVEREAADATVVTVLPITRSAPGDPASAVEIPFAVKRHLGLDCVSTANSMLAGEDRNTVGGSEMNAGVLCRLAAAADSQGTQS